MDWYDRRIVEFVVRWAPFGGPPEDDILPGFGLTRRQFAERFKSILSALATEESGLDESDSELLAAARRVITGAQRIA